MTQIDYLPPGLLPRKPVTSIGLTAALAVIVLPLVATLVFVVPRFEQIFKDFHSQLPAATIALLYLARWCSNVYIFIAMLLIPAVVPILTTRLFWRPHAKRSSHKSFWIVLLSVCIIYGFLTVTLIAPMTALIQTVNSPAH
jgi:hypothetical protein